MAENRRASESLRGARAGRRLRRLVRRSPGALMGSPGTAVGASMARRGLANAPLTWAPHGPLCPPAAAAGQRWWATIARPPCWPWPAALQRGRDHHLAARPAEALPLPTALSSWCSRVTGPGSWRSRSRPGQYVPGHRAPRPQPGVGHPQRGRPLGATVRRPGRATCRPSTPPHPGRQRNWRPPWGVTAGCAGTAPATWPRTAACP
jgi:hypothetical protein